MSAGGVDGCTVAKLSLTLRSSLTLVSYQLDCRCLLSMPDVTALHSLRLSYGVAGAVHWENRYSPPPSLGGEARVSLACSSSL